jgi:hypothetical protein
LCYGCQRFCFIQIRPKIKGITSNGHHLLSNTENDDRTIHHEILWHDVLPYFHKPILPIKYWDGLSWVSICGTREEDPSATATWVWKPGKRWVLHRTVPLVKSSPKLGTIRCLENWNYQMPKVYDDSLAVTWLFLVDIVISCTRILFFVWSYNTYIYIHTYIYICTLWYMVYLYYRFFKCYIIYIICYMPFNILH